MNPTFWRELDERLTQRHQTTIHYARDHSVDDALKQMGWLQGAIWSNLHVRESVTAMKEKRPVRTQKF